LAQFYQKCSHAHLSFNTTLATEKHYCNQYKQHEAQKVKFNAVSDCST